MWILFAVCILTVPWIIGNGCLCLFYGKSRDVRLSGWDALPAGWIALIGTAEAVHLAGMFLGATLSLCTALFCALTVIMLLVSLYVIIRSGKPVSKPDIFSVLPALFFLGLAVYILIWARPCFYRDMTLETVQSFLYTDGIYRVNPLTGAPYEAGSPLRYQILCLPTLYSIFCRLSSLSPWIMMTRVVPLIMLANCYGAFFCIGKNLFPESARRRSCFLCAVAAILLIGNYSVGLDGFGILSCGWLGTSIRNGVLVPYLISMCLEKKRIMMLLCIAAEACITWTLYGAGVCIAVAAGMELVLHIFENPRKLKGSVK